MLSVTPTGSYCKEKRTKLVATTCTCTSICSYNTLMEAFTGRVAVDAEEQPAVAADGKRIHAVVILDVVDDLGHSAARSSVLFGQYVRLVANMTDDKGIFLDIKAEVCIASSMPDLTSVFKTTALLLYDGCPENNPLLDEPLLFANDVGNSKVTRSNAFPMFEFDDSEYVFFHCAFRVCMADNAEVCEPSSCETRRRRKRAMKEPTALAGALDGQTGIVREMEDPDYQTYTTAVKVIRKSETSFLSEVDRLLYRTRRLVCVGTLFGVFVVTVLALVVIVMFLGQPRREDEDENFDIDVDILKCK